MKLHTKFIGGLSESSPPSCLPNVFQYLRKGLMIFVCLFSTDPTLLIEDKKSSSREDLIGSNLVLDSHSQMAIAFFEI